MNYIRFPYLWGLEFHINSIAFTIGDTIVVYWYGLIIASAFLLVSILGFRSAEKNGIKIDDLIDYIIFVLPASIIGARLYYVIFSDDIATYLKDPIEILRIWNGGLAIYGALIAIVITSFLVGLYKKQNFLKILDYAAPFILLAQGIGRWGNFTNQEAFGSNTFLVWGMTGNKIKVYLETLRESGMTSVNPQIPVHPTFLYEFLWCVVGFAILMILRKYKKNNGEMLLMYFFIYGLGRFWIEGLRLDSLYWGNFRVSQVLSAIMVIISAGLLAYLRLWKPKKKIVYEAEPEAKPDSTSEIIIDEDSEQEIADRKEK